MQIPTSVRESFASTFELLKLAMGLAVVLVAGFLWGSYDPDPMSLFSAVALCGVLLITLLLSLSFSVMILEWIFSICGFDAGGDPCECDRCVQFARAQ